jgi:hypothetical protein
MYVRLYVPGQSGEGTAKAGWGWGGAGEKVTGLVNRFQQGTSSLSSFLRLAKETLPIKTDMIIRPEVGRCSLNR